MGAPSTYTTELAETVCERIREGATLRQIEKEAGMPTKKTIVHWMAHCAEFGEQYARAMEIRALVQAIELDDISDDAGGEDSAVKVQRDRLRVSTRQWTMERMARKQLGPSSKVEMTGKDGKDLIPAQTVEDIDARIKQLVEANPGLLESVAKGGK